MLYFEVWSKVYHFPPRQVVTNLSVKVYTLKHSDSQSSSIGAALCRYEVCRHLLMRGGTHSVLHYTRGTQTRDTLYYTVSVQEAKCPQCKLVALNVASISRVSTFCVQRIEQREQKIYFKCSICWFSSMAFSYKKFPSLLNRENGINLSRWFFQYQHPGQWTPD